MDVKDFIRISLSEIIDGINGSKKALRERGSFIPTDNLVGEGVLFTSKDGNKTRHFIKVEFDIAVTISNNDELNAGGNISIVPFLGGKIKEGYTSKDQKENRLKFMIPIALPEIDK